MAIVAAGLFFAVGCAGAQSVVLVGMMGHKPLFIINGGSPKSLAANESHQGVTVVSSAGDQAVVEIAGHRRTLRVGEAPANVAASVSQGGRGTIALTADPNGLFLSQGTINGSLVQFVVDTGATLVGLGVADAERAGLNYRDGQPVLLSTANGVSQGWRIKLASVRIGNIELNQVDGVVSPMGSPYVLLGNSFLSQFQMKRENDQMTLERR
jgi:aspartyl protease family protein